MNIQQQFDALAEKYWVEWHPFKHHDVSYEEFYEEETDLDDEDFFYDDPDDDFFL